MVVEVLSDTPGRFEPGARLGLGDPEGRPRRVTVASARPDRGRLLARFRELGDRTAVEPLRGALLSIPTGQAAPPGPGSFYPHQLEGLAVMDERGARLGTLARVLAGPANDVWVVDADGGEVMLPAVGDVIARVDLEEGAIVVRPLPGLFE